MSVSFVIESRQNAIEHLFRVRLENASVQDD